MNKKGIGIILMYFLIFSGFGFAFGHSIGTEQQQKINAQLKIEYDELKNNYDGLEITKDGLIAELEWYLQNCHTQIGNLQEMYELNCECFTKEFE